MQIKNAILSLSLASLSLIARPAASAPSCHSEFSTSEFPNCVMLSPKFAAHWVTSDDSITMGFHVEASSDAWFAFGVSEGGGMRGTDMVVVQKKPNGGEWVASDRFSRDQVAPVEDASQDWILVKAPESRDDGTVVATVSRKLKTCDEDDYEIKKERLYPVVWAIGSGSEFGYHGPSNRGDARINFAPSEAQIEKENAIKNLDRTSFLNFTLAMKNYTIPARETSYTCMNFELPHDKKYHVVEYSPAVFNKYVHHIVIYQCQGVPLEGLDAVYDCTSMSAACTTFSMSWAPGIDSVAYPLEAGYAIGDGAGSMRYAALQIHYNNPTLDAGVVDSSGIVLTYTPNLRKHDIGILTVGSLQIEIPAGKSDVQTIPNPCSSHCTKRFNQTLTLLNNQFHMHYIGRKIKTQHTRGDKEIAPLGEKDYYDFNYQSPWPVEPASDTLIPGDSLITTCTFDGSSRTNLTRFGESSSDEMCFNFIVYYPKLVEYPEICFRDYFSDSTVDFCTSWSSMFEIGNMKTLSQKEKFQFLVDSGEIVLNATDSTFSPFEAEKCMPETLSPLPLSLSDA